MIEYGIQSLFHFETHSEWFCIGNAYGVNVPSMNTMEEAQAVLDRIKQVAPAGHEYRIVKREKTPWEVVKGA